jgi:Domain of unknown function (DUF4111)
VSCVNLGAGPEQYLEQLTLRLRAALSDPRELEAVYLSGSAVLGDWTDRASDLDVIAITAAPLRPDARQRVVAALGHRAMPCPARGLELVIYRANAVGDPSPPVQFELNLNTGAGMREQVTFDAADEPGHWFLLDLSVARAHGRALLGPRPERVIGAVEHSHLLGALAESLRWHESHEPSGANSVLNACRAWRYAVEEVWSSKTAAARWAVDHGGDARLLSQALAVRDGRRGTLDVAAAGGFRESVSALIAERKRAGQNSRHARDAR